MLKLATALACAALAPSGLAAQCSAIQLNANDPAEKDDLGESISFQGTTLLAGARLANIFGVETGAAYAFRDTGAGWALEWKLYASDGANGDEFGAAVAVRGDIAFVGAPGESTLPVGDKGAVYAFQRTGGAWSQTAKLVASDVATAQDAYFGYALALGPAIALIGAPQLAQDDLGRAYVFQRVAGVWTETAILAPADGALGDEFSRSVALEGNYAILGAQATDDSFIDSGSVYVYERIGSTWTLLQELHSPTPQLGSRFGNSVALEGGLLAVGDRERVQLFRLESGSFVHEATLAGLSAKVGDDFGSSVSVSSGRVAVGARLDDAAGQEAGAGYVFEQVAGVWKQRCKLISPEQLPNDYGGASIDLEGDRVAIGAYQHTVLGLERAGAVFVHDVVGTKACLIPVQPKLDVGDGQPTLDMTLNTSTNLLGKLYLIVGTLSGTNPGLVVDGLPFPINIDTYSLFCIQQPNVLPFVKFLGFVGPTGAEKPGLHMQSPLPALAGSTLNHAFVVLDLAAGQVVATSNATATPIVP